MVVSIDFLQTWSGTCWRTGLLLNIEYQTLNLVSDPQGTPTKPPLFFATFSRLLKRKKWRYTLLSWTSLLPTTVFQERSFGDTCKKNKTPQYLRDIIQSLYTRCLYLLIDDLSSEEVAPNRALKQGCPLSPLLYSLYNNDMDRFLTVKEVLPLPWTQFKSLTVIMLMTMLSLQTRLKICNSNWTNSMTIHVSKGSSSTLTKQKTWSSSARVTLRFPPSRTMALLWNLSLISNTLESLFLVMEACTQLLRRRQTTSGLP